jgi:hypothetical protein
MDNIIEPNNNFDFSKLSLAHPIGIQGGAYFTKILYNNKPLYIQTTKSLTRQGFVKSGKKYYCDLMFDNNSESLIQWFENLEETCQKLIFDKSEAWFQNSLDKNDVETAFNSVVRIYKSGKYYLVRTNIKIGVNNEPFIKIYNENETPLSIEDIKEDTNIISILEIQGIKFTSRNFQIDIELRQAMVLDNEPLFDNCLIKTYNSSKIQKQDNSLVKVPNECLENNTFSSVSTILEMDNNIIDNANNNNNETTENNINNANNHNNDDNMKMELDLELDLGEKVDNETEKNITEKVEPEELEDKLELKEVDLSFSLEDENLEIFENDTITLKKPNEVYYELYKAAREKAKLAKKNAIIAYLEAKNIKKTYMIDNLDESESDIDAEIDEVSESELEDF